MLATSFPLLCSIVFAVGDDLLTLQKEQWYWRESGKSELNAALLAQKKINEGIAKNVIIFIGDGMGPNTVTASRIYRNGETSSHFFETMPHVGLVKTYAVDLTVPDSACTATALFSGVKANYETVGLDGGVTLGDCSTSLDNTHHLSNIFDWAQKAGKSTGIVTTTRVTHATPASSYAQSADRRWECDGTKPPAAEKCKDIARQLIEDLPGKDFKVIMAGGRQGLQSNPQSKPNDPIDNWACQRKDGRDLIQEWKNDKIKRNATYAYLENKEDLDKLDYDTQYVMGLFANSHMPYEDQRDNSNSGSPRLDDMTKNAIRVLMRNPNGFILLVEGGLIDQAHHRGYVRRALEEVVHFDRAVELASRYTNEEDTLIIVTADHAHSLTINGIAKGRGDIFGTTIPSKVDGLPFGVLSYLIGGPNNFMYDVKDGEVTRKDPSTLDTSKPDYSAPGGFVNDESLHGGVDVAVFAQGPMAHLFHNVHEQSYIAHAIAYAAALGEYEDREVSGATTLSANPLCLTCTLFLFTKVLSLI